MDFPIAVYFLWFRFRCALGGANYSEMRKYRIGTNKQKTFYLMCVPLYVIYLASVSMCSAFILKPFVVVPHIATVALVVNFHACNKVVYTILNILIYSTVSNLCFSGATDYEICLFIFFGCLKSINSWILWSMLTVLMDLSKKCVGLFVSVLTPIPLFISP